MGDVGECGIMQNDIKKCVDCIFEPAAAGAKRGRCLECQKKRDKSTQKAHADRRRMENKRIIKLAKDRPCADCGAKYPTCVMDLDHLPGQEKYRNVANMLSESYSKVEEEIGKCEVVCANCHRIRTQTRRGLALD